MASALSSPTRWLYLATTALLLSINPVVSLSVIAGNTNEALGAAMALCAKEELLDNGRDNERSSSVPPPQLIAFFNTPSDGNDQQQKITSDTLSSLQNAVYFLGESTDNTEQMLAQTLQLTSRINRYENNDDSSSLIIHTSLHSDDKPKFDALSMTRNRFTFMGLHIKTALTASNDDGRVILSRDDAEELGNKLQTLLDGESQSSSSAAVIMDIRTHLAMLQANSLPKGVLGTKDVDVWAISDCIKDGFHVDNEDSLLLAYEYDYSDPYGGCDPLLRARNGYWVSPNPSNNVHEGSKDAFSAAYSVLMGTKMDPVSSMCIANGVKRVFSSRHSPPPYNWKTIDQIVQYSRIASNSVAEVNGLARKMYKEYGYK
jgi:hypothetical protein